MEEVKEKYLSCSGIIEADDDNDDDNNDDDDMFSNSFNVSRTCK